MLFEFVFSLKFVYFLLSLLIGYVLYFYGRQAMDRAAGRRPPGPWGFPYIGSLPYLEAAFHKSVDRLQDQYGPIYQFDLGVKPTVVISDHELVRQVYKNPITNARKHDAASEVWEENQWGMFFRDGDAGWKCQRKGAIKALSLFASAKNSKLSEAIANALEGFRKRMDATEGQPIEIRDDVFSVTGAVMTTLVYGLDSDFEDETQKRICKRSSELLAEMTSTMLVSMMPIIRPFFSGAFQRQRENFSDFNGFAWGLFCSHEYEGGEVRTIADGIKKASNELGEEELKEAGLTREEFQHVALDLYAAGMFDTAENSQWHLVLMAAFPEVQEAVYQELVSVTGGSRPVLSADQTEMKLGWAAVSEVIRFASTAPFTMGHCLSEDLDVAGYNLPKDTEIIANVWRMHRDPKVFPEPEKFDPQRFVDEPEKASMLMAFSTGGRRCIGESFARQEIFCVCQNILQDYQISLDPDTPGNPLEHQFVLTLQPGPHKLIFKRRK